MQHALRYFEFFEHRGDGARGVERCVSLAAAFGVGGEGVFELVGEAEVVDDEAAGFVAEGAIDARDGLHEAVALHGLVDLGVRVEFSQPHGADDDDAEGDFGLVVAALLALDVGVPRLRWRS